MWRICDTKSNTCAQIVGRVISILAAFRITESAKHTLRGGAVWSARRAHNPKVGGSNPPPATKISTGKNGKCSRLFFISDLEFAPGAYRQILQCLYGKWVESTRLRYLVPDYFGYYCLLRSYVTLLVTGVKTDEETARILSGHGCCNLCGLMSIAVVWQAMPIAKGGRLRQSIMQEEQLG